VRACRHHGARSFASLSATSLSLLVAILITAGSASAAPKPGAKPAPAPAAGHSVPTPGDVRELFEKGDYAQALRQATIALSAKGSAAAPDRYELLVLKGESQLRLKSNKDAAEAFDDASRCAKDDSEAALAMSMAELARRAKGAVYTAPAKKGEAARTFDITVRERRPAAFAAMFEESRPKVAAEVRAARGSGKLPAMFDAFRTLRDLRALELAATGADTQAAAFAADLTERAAELMARAVSEMGKTVEAVKTATLRAYDLSVQAKGGVSNDNLALLRQVAGDCDRIAAVAADLRKVFPGLAPDALRAVGADATAVAAEARTVAGYTWSDGVGYGPEQSFGPQGYGQPGAGQPPPHGGTNRVQKTNDPGNRSAGPRGVNTAGPR
jgi:hypothetical protein